MLFSNNHATSGKINSNVQWFQKRKRKKKNLKKINRLVFISSVSYCAGVESFVQICEQRSKHRRPSKVYIPYFWVNFKNSNLKEEIYNSRWSINLFMLQFPMHSCTWYFFWRTYIIYCTCLSGGCITWISLI